MGELQRGWTPEDIYLALSARGYSIRKLAAELGTTTNTLRRNIQNGESKSIRQAISKIVSTPEWELWPLAFPPQWREHGPPKD